jgi:hypothetical protein
MIGNLFSQVISLFLLLTLIMKYFHLIHSEKKFILLLLLKIKIKNIIYLIELLLLKKLKIMMWGLG